MRQRVHAYSLGPLSTRAFLYFPRRHHRRRPTSTTTQHPAPSALGAMMMENGRDAGAVVDGGLVWCVRARARNDGWGVCVRCVYGCDGCAGRQRSAPTQCVCMCVWVFVLDAKGWGTNAETTKNAARSSSSACCNSILTALIVRFVFKKIKNSVTPEHACVRVRACIHFVSPCKR